MTQSRGMSNPKFSSSPHHPTPPTPSSTPLYYLTGRHVVAVAHCTNSVHIFSGKAHSWSKLLNAKQFLLSLREKKKKISEKLPSFKAFLKLPKLGNAWIFWPTSKKQFLSEVSLSFAALSCSSLGIPRWDVKGGWTESERISLGDIKVKCWTCPLGIHVDDIMTMEVWECATPGPLNQIAW